MTIAPVRASVDVSQPPAEAFELFALRIGDWWQGNSIGDNARVSLTIEPHTGGRWFETDANGNEPPWGKVLAWDPPSRLLLAWELNSQFKPDPSVLTEIEIAFVPLAGGGTGVSLEHRNLERFGVDAERVATSIGQGWPKQFGGFQNFAAAENEGKEP